VPLLPTASTRPRRLRPTASLLLGPRTLAGDGFILEGVNRVAEEIYREWTRRAVPQAGDLVLAREAPVGNIAIIPPGLKICLGQRTVLIRPDRGKGQPALPSIFLLSDRVQGRIQSMTSGGRVGHLNVKDIRDLDPSGAPVAIKLQTKIGNVLSSYDDLIENNTRRIQD